MRYTTIELVVDISPMRARQDPQAIVEVLISPREKALRARAFSVGGVWAGGTTIWKMTYAAAKTLGIEGRIVTIVD
jgi:hypothetical protein